MDLLLRRRGSRDFHLWRAINGGRAVHWWMAGVSGAFSLLGAVAFILCVRQRRSFDRQCAAARQAERVYLSRKATFKTELGLP